VVETVGEITAHTATAIVNQIARLVFIIWARTGGA
jgi:hypothetical protein